MPDIEAIKAQLVSELLYPEVKKGGDLFYPRLRKNKNMKLLTLLTDNNYTIIETFVNNKLTQTKSVYVWSQDYRKVWRIITSVDPARVDGTCRYENSITSQSFPLTSSFPFDVINLDFSSQEPFFDPGRVENEILGVERTIKLQRDNNSNQFIIIYTTILNSNNLEYNNIRDSSYLIYPRQWTGLHINGYPPIISDNNQKLECIHDIIGTTASKYNYISQLKSFQNDYEQHKKLISIVGILRGL